MPGTLGPDLRTGLSVSKYSKSELGFSWEWPQVKDLRYCRSNNSSFAGDQPAPQNR